MGTRVLDPPPDSANVLVSIQGSKHADVLVQLVWPLHMMHREYREMIWKGVEARRLRTGSHDSSCTPFTERGVIPWTNNALIS